MYIPKVVARRYATKVRCTYKRLNTEIFELAKKNLLYYLIYISLNFISDYLYLFMTFKPPKYEEQCITYVTSLVSVECGGESLVSILGHGNAQFFSSFIGKNLMHKITSDLQVFLIKNSNASATKRAFYYMFSQEIKNCNSALLRPSGSVSILQHTL